jgi:nicotinate-nucleotide--dimethylbenzimidazole phosphoribosyltransferase
MVENFAAGGAADQSALSVGGLGLKVYDLALDLPTGDITAGRRSTRPTCAATMAFGMEAVAGGVDLLCIGEMGIGNTTVAAALFLRPVRRRAEDWVGPGTGLDARGLARKRDAVSAAIARHAGHLADPLEACGASAVARSPHGRRHPCRPPQLACR